MNKVTAHEDFVPMNQFESKAWTPPKVPERIPQGDMPGDKVNIGQGHIDKANNIFPALLPLLASSVEVNPHQRAVLAVCGGSGVGKSEIASLLSFFLQDIGIGSYTLSGDNYPHRIPKHNDSERLRLFRAGGLHGLITNGLYSPTRAEQLRSWQMEERDAEKALAKEHSWLSIYQREGRNALKAYLGTPAEQNFAELTQIIAQFKNGSDDIWLKRMGRTESELWYDKVDFCAIRVLVVEWTHGNSDYLQGIDIPILLNSTPQETKEHRKSRNRDGQTDSAFTEMVLEVEQVLLETQAAKAQIIASKSGELLSYTEYRQQMADR